MSKVEPFVFEPGVEYVKIHGLQRTGTNYLAQLINDNFENAKVLMNAGGWKHGHYCAPWSLGREVHVLTITKNPYAWLVSLYKYWRDGNTGPDLSKTGFDLFLLQRAIFEEAAGTPYLLRASNPVQHWNNMNYHWLSIRMNTKQALAIPYEALLFDARGVIEQVGAAFGLKQKDEFRDCEQICEPGNESPKIAKERWEGREHYVEERYLDEYSTDSLRFVTDQLDEEVMALLGYKKFPYWRNK